MEGNPFKKLQELAQKAREEGVVDQTPVDIFKRGQQEQKKPVGVSLEEAEKIFGKDFLGPKAVEQVFKIPLVESAMPSIPFSREELERAKELGQQLIYQVETMKTGDDPFGSPEIEPLTLEVMRGNFAGTTDQKPIFYEQDWYVEEDFYKNEKPRLGWKLVLKDVIPDSTSKNYIQQTEVLISYLKNETFKGRELPKEYTDAIVEFEEQKAAIVERIKGDEWQDAAPWLADLAITKLTRESPVEVMYRLILNESVNKEKLLPSKYTWTSGRGLNGKLVFVGYFASDGANVGSYPPGRSDSYLGVSFSRMK